jgi:uncharacterized protein (DUF4415 family)
MPCDERSAGRCRPDLRRTHCKRIEITVIYTDVSRTERRIISAWGQSGMKEKRTGRASLKGGTDWNRLRSQSDRQTRRAIQGDPEALPADAEFWKKARVVMPAAKQTITIRLDADLLEWLRKQKGYQTRINAVLRTYMDASVASTRRG